MGDGGARAHPAGSRGDGVATRRWSGKRRWGRWLEGKRGKRSEREVEGTDGGARGRGKERESGEFARRPERPHRVLSNDPGGSSR